MKNIAYMDYGTDELKKDYFLTILNLKNDFYRSRDKYEGVYFSVSNLQVLLGESKYKKRLDELKFDGYISSYISPTRKSKYNRQLYFIIPNKRESKQVRTVSDVGFITRYVNLKYDSIIQQDLEYQYQTLTRTKFELDGINYESISTNNLDYYNSTIHRINTFNDSSKYEKVNYISKDNFSGRVHSIITNIPHEFRNVISISGRPTMEIDLKQAQLMMLSEILLDNIGQNSFSDMLESGADIYLFIKDQMDLASRDKAKEYTFSMLFGRPASKKALKLYELFPEIKDFITRLKSNKMEGNTREYHTNLAYLLQTYEVDLFSKVWRELKKQKIKYLSVHDSIITNSSKAYKIMETVLSNELTTKPVLTIK